MRFFFGQKTHGSSPSSKGQVSRFGRLCRRLGLAERARFPSSASFETKHLPPARFPAPVSWPRIVPKQLRLCDINLVTVSQQFPESEPFSDCARRMILLSNTTATM